MSKKKKWLIWLGIIISVLVVLGAFFFNKKEAPTYQTEKVKRSDISQTVSITGELKSKQEIDLNFENSGRIKSISVYEGKKVAEGDVLALIDDAILGQEAERAKSALDKALALAGASDDTIREAEEVLDNADDVYDKTQELENQKVSQAEIAYDEAVNYYEDVLDYYEKEVDDHGDSSSEAKYAKISLTQASGAKNEAEQALKTAKKSRDLNIISAKNAKDLAKEQLSSAEGKFVKSSNQADVASARIAYEIALTNLGKTSLKAPTNGIITKVNFQAGEVFALSSGNFAQMVASDLIIEADVPESDIVKVKNDQIAKVYFDALGQSEQFEAKVVEIEPASTVIQDVVYYKIKLALNGADGRLKEGMSVDVDIQTARKENALSVPSRAVRKEGKKSFVEVLFGEEMKDTRSVEVKTGVRGDDGEVEIVSGLSEGEQVVVSKNEDNK